VLLTAISLIGVVSPAAGADQADRPRGWYYGTDSYAPLVRGGRYPYLEPKVGGMYGSYGAEVGTWTDWMGCTRGYAIERGNVERVNRNNERDRSVPGVQYYWFAAGPGGDPHFNGRYGEAYSWGRRQAIRANSDYYALARRGLFTKTRYIPIMFMDIESQPFAGYGNGWNEVVNRCGRITRHRVIPVNIDRATFNGFTDYLRKHTIFHPGVYSIPSFWTQTFGTGSASRIPNIKQWTPVTSTPGARPRPRGYRQRNNNAYWFGGVLPANAVAWQWTQNGGDYDQWDTARLPR